MKKDKRKQKRKPLIPKIDDRYYEYGIEHELDYINGGLERRRKWE